MGDKGFLLLVSSNALIESNAQSAAAPYRVVMLDAELVGEQKPQRMCACSSESEELM